MRSWTSVAQATLALLLFAAPVQASDWLVFQSDRGFSVDYPAGWYRLDDRTESLDIISSRDTLTGVIIGKGAEMIWVGERTDVPAEGHLERMIAAVRMDPADEVISVERDVFVSGEKDRCSSISSLTQKIEVGPKTYQRAKHILCPVGARLFIIATWRWENDPPRADTPEIMTRIVKSLRVSP